MATAGGVGDGERNAVPVLRHGAAGVGAGIVATSLLHPLDVIKTRFQVQDGGRSNRVPVYRGTVDAVLQICRTESWRGLYRGLTPAMLGASSSWGIYFVLYNLLKREAEARNGTLGTAEFMACAILGGAGTSLATNPIWLVKTRLQLQLGGLRANERHRSHYHGMRHAFQTIWREEGLRGLYRGLVPSLLLSTHGAFQFSSYEALRKHLMANRPKDGDSHLSVTESLAAGATSKVIASTLTYPQQVVRARLQQEGANGNFYYRGFINAVVATFRYEGIRGFFKGIVPNVLRVAPSSAVTFAAYERISRFLADSGL